MFVADTRLEWTPTDGYVTLPGPVNHRCPEPFSPEVARKWRDFIACYEVPVHPRFAARIRLGLRMAKAADQITAAGFDYLPGGGH
jgi:hypothetical protein